MQIVHRHVVDDRYHNASTVLAIVVHHRVLNIMNVNSIMVREPHIYAMNMCCYKICCFDAATNTYLGKCV